MASPTAMYTSGTATTSDLFIDTSSGGNTLVYFEDEWSADRNCYIRRVRESIESEPFHKRESIESEPFHKPKLSYRETLQQEVDEWLK